MTTILLPALRKYPTETRTETFDFTEKLDVAGGETIVAPTITVSAGITNSAPSVAGPLVSARFGGGTAGNDYTVACQVTTSVGQVLKIAFTLEVRDAAN